MDEAPVVLEIADTTAVLTLNDPSTKNALSVPMCLALLGHLESLQQMPDVRAVILTGAGDAFSAGGNIKRMASLPGGRDSRSEADNLFDQSHNSLARQTVLRMTRLEKPVIAAINGPALGWGMDISLACDIRLASSRAKFGELFVLRGVISGVGSMYLLPRLVGLSRATELLLTGRIMKADEAERIGLVSAQYDPEDLMTQASAMAHSISEAAPLAVQLTKRGLYSSANMQGDLEAALTEAMYLNQICLSSNDHSEAANAYLEGRPPRFTGS